MSDQPTGGEHSDSYSMEVKHANVSARVPEKVARGALSNGVLVFQNPTEFVLDFLLRLSRPHQVAARIVVPIPFMPKLIAALRENIDNYKKTFGALPTLPPPPVPPKPPSVDEIYENLKVADELMSGVYANGALVSHSWTEFCFDFITSFYPRAAVSARVYLSAPQVPSVLNNLCQAWQNFESKQQGNSPR